MKPIGRKALLARIDLLEHAVAILVGKVASLEARPASLDAAVAALKARADRHGPAPNPLRNTQPSYPRTPFG